MVKIRLPSTGQIYYLKSDLDLNPGQEVLIEQDGILEIAHVILSQGEPPKEVIPEFINPENLRITRKVDSADCQIKRKLTQKARTFLPSSRAKVREHNLPMKILDALLSFDEKKLTFFFSAEGRVDFRSLAADMVASFQKIIRLQQVGPREEAKFFGGFGRCGKTLCCASFMNSFEDLNLDLANLKNSLAIKSKLIGCCGRMMCCLAFEKDFFKKSKARAKD